MGYNYTCLYCGRPGKTSKTAHLEHIIPISCGGPRTAGNEAWACKPCNLVKSKMGPVSFAVWLLENPDAVGLRDGENAASLTRFARDPWAELEQRLPRIYWYDNQGNEKYQFIREWYKAHAPSLLSFKASLLKER